MDNIIIIIVFSSALFLHFFPGANRHAEFSNFEPGPNKVQGRELLRGSFEVTDDPKRCTVHLINSEVSVEGDVVTVEFAGSGVARSYSCKLDA